MKAARLALSSQQQLTASQHISQLGLSLTEHCQKVALYFALNGEVSTQSLLQHLQKLDKAVYLPKISPDQNQLTFAPIGTKQTFMNNQFGIPEPDVELTDCVSAESLDLIFLPLVAFDQYGNRLGMGAGFYDRTLQFKPDNPTGKPKLFGLAYEFQAITNLVPDSWDIPLDGVVTEKQVYFFKE